MKPEITVIIPAYNVAPWIGDTLRSVMRQTFANFVCIVIDDGSTDDTYAVFTATVNGDSRFQIYRQENAGECAARNAGIRLAETVYITFLDSDDIWHRDYLRLMCLHLQNNVHFVACHYVMFYDGTTILKPHAWRHWQKSGNLWWDTLSHGEFVMGAWAARLEDIKAVGFFRKNLKVAGDRDFILRLLAYLHKDGSTSKAILLPQTLLAYRQRQGSAVRDVAFALRHEWDMMQTHINHPAIPKHIRRRALSYLAFKMAVIALFGAHNYKLSFEKYWRAFVICPWNINLFVLPIRRIVLLMLPNREIPWLKHFLQSATRVEGHEFCATNQVRLGIFSPEDKTWK